MSTAPGPEPFPDMIWVPGRTFLMGSDVHYPEERPAHHVAVDGFWIDRYPVTNARFTRFAAETEFATCAERPPDPADYPDALPEMLFAGSLVFTPTDGPVDTRDLSQWWTYVKGAHWRAPYGPGSSIEAIEDHPVVHVTVADAEAFAAWEGKTLPTEAEWELAARGGLEGATYAWGEDFLPEGRHRANTWQGEFPWQQLAVDGFERTSPVSAFAPNGYGISDLIGNVWEWTTDWYGASHPVPPGNACCIPLNPRGARADLSYDPEEAHLRIPRKVLKGGSHLCAPNYCQRYRPAARSPQPVDTSTSHVGFRCVVRAHALRASNAKASDHS